MSDAAYAIGLLLGGMLLPRKKPAAVTRAEMQHAANVRAQRRAYEQAYQEHFAGNASPQAGREG